MEKEQAADEIPLCIGRHYPTSRYRHQGSCFPSRSCSWHRALPISSHSSHVKETCREVEQDKTLYQNDKLYYFDDLLKEVHGLTNDRQSSYANSVHVGAGGSQGSNFK